MIKQKQTLKTLILCATLLPILFACTKPAPPRTELVLGTVCTINLFEHGTEARYNTLFTRLAEIDEIMSANRDDSTIGRINAFAGKQPVKADPETLFVIESALRFAEQSSGLFDPTVGPLVKLWDIGGDTPAVPSATAIQTARALIDWRKVIVDRDAGTVFLNGKGMRLDLGAIAKGYAADQLAGIIREWDLERAMIDLGGNILALGNKDRDTPWHIGVRNPEVVGGASVISLFVTDSSMVTSGINERFFMDNGNRYHHILNPQSGYPAESDVLSVSILSGNSMEADALSTILFLLGTTRGLEYIKTVAGAEAIFIDRARKVHTSPGLSGRIRIRDTAYSPAED